MRSEEIIYIDRDRKIGNYVEAIRLMFEAGYPHIVLCAKGENIDRAIQIASKCKKNLNAKILFYTYSKDVKNDGERKIMILLENTIRR